MSRTVISASVAILASSACMRPDAVAQRGVGPRPRMPTYDGQPMTTNREIDAYVDGGPTTNRSNIARVQAGAAMRLRAGPSWDATVTIDAATGLGMVRSGTSTVTPPRGLAVGVGGTLRKSVFDGPFRLGLLLGAQLWRVPINDEEMNAGGAVAPAAFTALVPNVRFGSVVVFLGLSLQAAVAIPDRHEADSAPLATTTLGAAGNLGLRIDVSEHVWTSFAAGMGANEEEGTFGATLSIGYGLSE